MKDISIRISSDKEETFIERKKSERKRVSFDLRVDLHKEFKTRAAIEERNIYEMIEEAMEVYLGGGSR